jgi:nucleotide-binding universal stress UspA family protein
MFKNIYVPVDNSDYSNECIDIALEFAGKTGATVSSSHVYAAKMHDVRFRQMESGLPEEYQDEQELEKQRNIHDQLITKGMEVITDSYLDVPKFKCKDKNIPFVGKSLEGRNWIELVRDINESNYDLVVMGVLGLGAIKDSSIGTVTERVIRRIQTDTLIVKHIPELHGDQEGSGKIVVAVDGSGHSFGGLKTGIQIAKLTGRPLEIISSFDPYFHYAMFNSLTGVLSKEASKVFKFEQQEKLHEDIIDKGLAKIYQAHLEISKNIAKEEGLDCTIRLLDGKVFEKVLQYAREEKPHLLILGRIGVHSAPDMDIGGNTENLLRLVPCNVMLSSRVFKPKVDMVADESIEWTSEASERLQKIPGFVRPMATTAILRYALERGHSMITSGVITEACENILPAGAMQAMNMIGDKLRDQGKQDGVDAFADSNVEKMIDTNKMDCPVETKLKCQNCGAVMGFDAIKCGVCDAGPLSLKPIDMEEFAVNVDDEGGIGYSSSFAEKDIQWTQHAWDLLDNYSEGHIRRKAQARVEKNARVQNVTTISVAFVNSIVNEKTTAKGSDIGNDNGNGNGNGANGDNGAHDESKFTWDEDATARIERVPPGFMRDNTMKRVLDYAVSINATHITLQVCEQGIEASVKIMAEAVANGATIEDFLPKKDA